MTRSDALVDALARLRGIPVRVSSTVPLFNLEGVPQLFLMLEGVIYVHPERWDEFVLMTTQPEIALMPEMREMFRAKDRERRGES